jgi:ribosome biogenesis GTPase A
MSAESTKTAKMSKQVGKLKKFFQFESRSTSESQSRSDSPSPSVAPLGVAHVSTVSTTDPAPSVNPAPTVTITLEEAAKLRATYTHFRVLVIGRANAGKTTLLKRVCGTKEDPVYNSVSYRLYT